MPETAKLFMNGQSQAVRLPKKLRFEGISEVFIYRNKAGDVVLSERPESWDSFLAMQKNVQIPEAFMAERDSSALVDKALF